MDARTGVVALGAAGVLASGVGSVAPAAATADDEQHCVLRILGRGDDGQFRTAPLECYPTLEEALAASDPPAGAGLRAEVALASSSTLSTHWDGSNRSGSSITITGSDCAGGTVNLSGSWTNRISSTRNYCPATRFFDGFDKGGGHETTSTSTVNLGALNNASNSVYYGPA